MDNISKLLEGLKSPDKNTRFDACEELRVSPVLPDEAIHALEDATKDPDELVADAALRALQAHQQNQIPKQPVQAQVPLHKPQLRRKRRSAPELSLSKPERYPTVQMPASSPNSQQYILALEKRVMYLEVEIERLNRIAGGVPATSKLPNTEVISPNFFSRAFAIWGHYFVAQLIIAILIYGFNFTPHPA